MRKSLQHKVLWDIARRIYFARNDRCAQYKRGNDKVFITDSERATLHSRQHEREIVCRLCFDKPVMIIKRTCI